MLELILVLILGSIGYSFFQGLRRGKVSDEERRNNPTLIEVFANALHDLNENIEKHEIYRDAEKKYCTWFVQFSETVLGALRLAEEQVRREEADSFYGSHRYINKLPKICASSLKSGPCARPSFPVPTKENQLYLKIYDAFKRSQESALDEAKRKIKENPAVRSKFLQNIRNMGLADVLEDYFQELADGDNSDCEEKRNQRHPAFLSTTAHGERGLFNKERSSLLPSKGTVDVWPLESPGVLDVEFHSPRVNISIEDAERDPNSEVRAIAEELSIPHLVHFTSCENLRSIFRHGLLSVSDCRAQGIHAVRNDMMRLDGKPEGTSLSVTFPNYRMFYKYRQVEPAADWAVLILSVSILWKKECTFFKHNAADARMRGLSREHSATAQAFREMFENSSAPRQPWLRPYDPVDPQAEVMAYEAIEPDLIEAVAFETKDAAEKWKSVLGGIDTIYAGRGKGLFGSRAQIRGN